MINDICLCRAEIEAGGKNKEERKRRTQELYLYHEDKSVFQSLDFLCGGAS